jgi:2'-5' RNA ligase
MYLRCFIAIEIPDSIRGEIGNLIETLRKYSVDVKWVDHNNIHLTLKFLGKTPEDLIPGINDSLQKVALSYEPLYIKICSTGLFPNKKYPRVIWVGIEDSEVLERLQKDIDISMASLGFQREERAFHPHLTVGRVRSQKGMAEMIDELENFKEKDFGIITVSMIKLMLSELRPTGAQYSCLREIHLGRRGNDK